MTPVTVIFVPFISNLAPIVSRALIVAIMSLETVLLGINLNFIVFSYHFFEFGGKLIPLILLASTAAESAIGLSILVVLYRVKKNIKFISLTSTFFENNLF